MNTISESQLATTISEDSQEILCQKYKEVRAHSVKLCDPLQIEDFVVQPVADVSPPKWHLAHTTWFFEEFFLVPLVHNYSRYHPDYSFLFNSYYESVGERVLRPNRGNLSRPTVEEIQAYRMHVDDAMIALIPKLNGEQLELLELGLNHEQQHQELLLTDIKYILGHNPLFPPYDEAFEETKQETREEGFIEIPDGIYEIGFEGRGFHFDNEKQRHKVYLDNYQIRKSLVTNEEYLSFM